MSQKYIGGFITKSPTAPTTAAAKGIWTLDQAANYRKQGIWPATPGAPTIGTATAGISSATVTYTAPSNLGAGAVTYTATSSPGGLTGTGASPITVSGLTNGTAYTFTVTASTPGGTGPASAASNSVTPTSIPGAIGIAYGGGFYAGQISTAGNSIADFNLVISPRATGQVTNNVLYTRWKDSLTTTPGADSAINGTQNTADMVADGSSTVYPAGHFCNNLVTGGFSDWYMPAKNELEICYFNLKPTTESNYTSSGINPNAVPARASNYTTGTPARTSATVFQTGNSEAFTATYPGGIYWSSTESGANYGLTIYFSYGRVRTDTKTNYQYSVRAVRRVAV